MSSAPNYNPETSFADDETNNVAGRSLVKTDSLDSELANISTSINGLNANLQAIQRDDNKLQDSVVEPYALAEQTRALIATSGSNPRGVWAPNTDYKFKDVIQRSNVAQMALQDHNSGSVFTQSFWLPISGDGTSAANAAAAAASASSAATSASSATASASSATASESAASTSATNAATSATNAVNSAISASTNAAIAANSADEAIAAAESITIPLNATSDPTFASIVNDQAVSPEWVRGLFGTKLNMQVFTSSGTFTVPDGVTKIKATVVGGGGNGGNGIASSNAGAGGGGAGTAIGIYTVTPGSAVSITVGSATQASSFGSFCSAAGGSSASGLTPGSGGVGSGGNLNLRGSGANSSVTTGFGGCGGNSSIGGGGNGGVSSGSAQAGGSYGGGGGGGSGTSGFTAGGAGAPGIVIVEW